MILKSLRQDIDYLKEWKYPKGLYYKYRNLFLGLKTSKMKSKINDTTFFSLDKRDYANHVKMVSEFNHILKQIPKLEVVIDVGANIGLFTLLALHHNKSAKIYALEPMIKIYLKLLANTIDYKNVTQYHLAASNRKKKVQMKYNQEDHSKSKIEEMLTYDNVCDAIRLDALTKTRGINHIDMLKIDVEGHELDVLFGARKTLDICDNVLIEVENNKIFYVALLFQQKGFELKEKQQHATYCNLWYSKK